MSKLTASSEWKALESHYRDLSDVKMRDLFAMDGERADRFSLEVNGILLDYSKNIVTETTMQRLYALARSRDLSAWIARMFQGDKINSTENRSVLHIALRNRSDRSINVDGEDVMQEVNAVLAKMKKFSDSVRSGKWLGYTGKPITDVVNIGIGGSDLGPVMVTEALKSYGKRGLKVHFVSNIDGTQVMETLRHLDAETTLFVIASKTFTTQETLVNANTAKDWFLRSAIGLESFSDHNRACHRT